MPKYKISLREKETGKRIGCLKDERGKLVLFQNFDEAVSVAKKEVAKSGDTITTSIYKIKG